MQASHTAKKTGMSTWQVDWMLHIICNVFDSILHEIHPQFQLKRSCIADDTFRDVHKRFSIHAIAFVIIEILLSSIPSTCLIYPHLDPWFDSCEAFPQCTHNHPHFQITHPLTLIKSTQMNHKLPSLTTFRLPISSKIGSSDATARLDSGL